ncbi:MAG: lipoprotein LpqH [Streptomycetaceae bacterium]|nr:lipoprotein LpqH [Streptomycetaceae bacterium]
MKFDTTAKTCAALTGAAVAAALLVTGCSDDASPKHAATAPPATSAQAAPKSASRASVDGAALTASFTTTCARRGDILALALTDTANAAYGNLGVTASITRSNTVSAVGFAGTKGGSNGLPYALGFGNGMPGGSAAVSKDGNTFHVTGEGVAAPDMTNPTAGPKTAKFDITFACQSIVGG